MCVFSIPIFTRTHVCISIPLSWTCVLFAPAHARQASETVLDTEGCNLLSVMSLDEVDATRTLSNDIIEVFRVLGIEACRRSLYNEIYRILESSAVNYRHLVRFIF